MTLLIGILCSNGAVIAADKQATHGAFGMPTVGQSVTKISAIDGTVLFGSSGHLGMSQQFEALISPWVNEGYFAKNTYAIAISRVQQGFRPIVEGAFKTATAAAPIVGAQAAQADCICGSILATSFRDGVKIVEITPQVTVEFLTPELSFIALGSVKQTADPFLGFLKKIFWPDRLPTVREGILAGFWTVSHAIDMRVSGVGLGVDLFTFEQQEARWSARQVSDGEIEEHRLFIGACEDALRAVQASIAKPEAEAAPVPTPQN